MSPYNLYQFILHFTELFPIYSRITASGGIFIFYYMASYPIPATRLYETALARDNTDHSVGRYYWDGDETGVNVQVRHC